MELQFLKASADRNRRRPASRSWRKEARCLAHAAALTVAGAALISVAVAQQPAPANPTPQERAAMLQQWMKASQAQLRSYEWVETTIVAKGGEEKSRKESRCYYAADGKLQKIPIQDAAGSQESGREGPLGKRLKEKKKEEMTSYMQSVVQLVHSYVPPDPSRIQQSVNSGKLSANIIEPGRRVQLDFKDYLKAGDVLSAQIEMPTNRLLGIGVSSYLDSPDDPVRLDVGMGVLPDGTIYTAKSVLEAKAKGLAVTVENSGYRKTAQ